MLNIHNRKIQIGDTEMYYATFGRGKRSLVVLPGLSDGLATVKGLALFLAPPYRIFMKDFTVYMFSRKNKMPEGYSIKDMADDQVLVMQKLGIEKACVLGVSQGGMIAQCIAIYHPEVVERLILAVTAPYANDTATKAVSGWIDMAKRGDHAALMLDTAENDTPEVDENGDSLTLNQRRDYYLHHYFDNLPLDDNFYVRTPKAVFYDRVMPFFDSYLKYAPPEVIKEFVDTVMRKALKAPDVFQYLVIRLTEKYLQSNVMVHDEVYVYLVQNYFATSANFWSSPSGIEKELIRANKWERLLVGHQAPELILYDTLHHPHSLHAMPSRWKLLIFWSPNCGHCKHIIPKVYEIYMANREKYDLGVFAILSEPDDKTRVDWHNFLRDNGIDSPTWINLDGGEANVDWHDVYDITSTPQIYLLDQYNIIQAKKLSDGNLEQVLRAICGSQEKQ